MIDPPRHLPFRPAFAALVCLFTLTTMASRAVAATTEEIDARMRDWIGNACVPPGSVLDGPSQVNYE